MRDWKKNPPTEEEKAAAYLAMEFLRKQHGQDIETLFFAKGEQIIVGTIEGIREFNSGKITNEVIEIELSTN